jgi:hypothetical protein
MMVVSSSLEVVVLDFVIVSSIIVKEVVPVLLLLGVLLRSSLVDSAGSRKLAMRWIQKRGQAKPRVHSRIIQVRN